MPDSPVPNENTPVPPWADPLVPVESLDAQGVSRRGVLRSAGLLGTGLIAAGAGVAAPAAADERDRRGHGNGHGQEDPELMWLVGDHHVHSRYSNDAKYDVSQQAYRGAQFGLDWMVMTEHSNVAHASKGAAAENVELVRARVENPRMLIFQGLEWYIPAAEHATVFVAPGPREVQLLTEFESRFDGNLLGRTQGKVGDPATAGNEALAADAIRWLGQQQRAGVVDDVLVLANHPSRLGIDSPHELRTWRDADPTIAIGMEGAPGAQGDSAPEWLAYRASIGRAPSNPQRGEYSNTQRADSWPAYPPEAYRTHGGFDWMTATVGGMWDSMLAEGRLWSITTNSDNHRTIFDSYTDGVFPAGQSFTSEGAKPSPTLASTPQLGSDYWPGQFSRTHVGVRQFGYLEVMAAMRAGRVWVDHGQLVDALDVRVTADGVRRGVTLGGRLSVRRGERVSLQVTVTTASRPNLHGLLPALAHLDVIRGLVTGPVADRDAMRAPDSRVVEQVDVRGKRGTFTLSLPLGRAKESCYVRLRGSDGRRNGPGLLGSAIDPAGPIPQTAADGDPWLDTWLYTNPIFIDVRR